MTLAFSLRGDFPWKRLPGYVVVQLAGAVAACFFLWAVLGKHGDLGATEPGAGVHGWQALLVELVLTVGLVSTVLGTPSKAQNVGPLAALGVGGYIALAGLWASPVTGASMDPARSFGPDSPSGTSPPSGSTLSARSPAPSSPSGSPGALRGPPDAGEAEAARGRTQPD